MTFRRVMLVVLPLLVALFAFMVLRYLFLDWEAGLPTQPLPGQRSAKMPTGPAEMPTRQNISHDRSENINLVRKDVHGRTEMRFLADSAEHQTRDTADIARPRLQFFTRSGEIITLLADRARVVTKGSLASVADIESGVLTGNVVMSLDRRTPDDHSDDILISLSDLAFNNETFEMSTDGPVVLSGLEVCLTARKMQMVLDRKTRRITMMTFWEDIYIVLEAGDRARMGLLGATPDETPAADAPAPAATAPAKSPASRTPRAAPAPAAADDTRGEVWWIDLTGDVDARQGVQRLAAESVSLYNRTSGGALAGTTPTARPAQAGQDVGPEPPDTAKEGDAIAKAKFLQPGASPPLIVMANGPLIVTPVAPDERKALGDAANQMVATGDPVVVDDGQTRIVGAEVRYNTKTGSGSVIGKDSPVLLDQPGRLRLTGGRLDFDRPQGVAEIRGEGQLHAVIQPGTFATSGKPKTPPTPPDGGTEKPPQEPSTLDASWARGMRLDFYQMPTQATSGLGELRRAVFLGQAVVNQTDGLLKGDELTIDFFKAEEGRGQAVERLIGHGNVFVKNAPPETKGPPPALPPAPEPAAARKDSARAAIGDIACQDLDLLFARDATGATQPKQLKASGAVAINDPQGKILAEKLDVTFGPTAKGATEAQFLEAFGKVLIDRTDLHAEGDHVRRDLASGMLLLEGKPARAKRGEMRIVGPRIEFAQNEGRATVAGAGELEMPATSDLRGRPRAKAEPMLIQWQHAMLFDDPRNFAQFDGAVRAATGASRLSAQRLWIYFADRPEPPAKTGPATAADAAARAAAGAAAVAAPAKEKPKSDTGDMQQFFGRKSIVRVLAEKDVRAVEQQLADDKTLRYAMEIAADNLTYLEENRKAYTRGVGRLRILSREKPKAGQTQPPGLAPDAGETCWTGDLPETYSRTEVLWADSMAYDGATDRAYFKGDVDATYAGRSAPGGAGVSSRRGPTVTRIKSTDLQVAFSEKKTPGAAASPAAAAVPARPGVFVVAVPATPASAAPAPAKAPKSAAGAASDVPREERMAIDKMVADGSVQLWVDNRRGTAERVIYQRDPELIRLYRGPDDWARLWQEDEASQQYDEIVARTITFEPSTGRVDVVEQQTMIVGPKPKPLPPKPVPKVQPGPKPLPPVR